MFYKRADSFQKKEPETIDPNVELNVNGEAKYLYALDGALIINDPTLLLGKVMDPPEVNID